LEEDTRKRFAIANATIETCAEFLSNPETHKATNGLSERALYLLSLLYIPNNIEGVYDLSQKGVGEERIPYIITHPKEKIRVHRKIKHALHPFQYEGLYGSMCDIEQQELTEAKFEKRLKYIRKSYKDEHGEDFKLKALASLNADASVNSPASAIGLGPKGTKPKTYILRGSPIIVGDEMALSEGEGSVLFHEMVHVDQDLSGRLFLEGSKELKDEKYTSELKAYRAQAVALSIHLGVSINGDSEYNSFGVEAARRTVNSDDDPFRVSKKLFKAIERNGSRLR